MSISHFPFLPPAMRVRQWQILNAQCSMLNVSVLYLPTVARFMGRGIWGHLFSTGSGALSPMKAHIAPNPVAVGALGSDGAMLQAHDLNPPPPPRVCPYCGSQQLELIEILEPGQPTFLDSS